MKIAVLGGTGNIGKGFALRLSYKHEVTIGSRNVEKAKASAAEYNEILEKYGNIGNGRITYTSGHQHHIQK